MAFQLVACFRVIVDHPLAESPDVLARALLSPRACELDSPPFRLAAFVTNVSSRTGPTESCRRASTTLVLRPCRASERHGQTEYNQTLHKSASFSGRNASSVPTISCSLALLTLDINEGFVTPGRSDPLDAFVGCHLTPIWRDLHDLTGFRRFVQCLDDADILEALFPEGSGWRFFQMQSGE